MINKFDTAIWLAKPSQAGWIVRNRPSFFPTNCCQSSRNKKPLADNYWQQLALEPLRDEMLSRRGVGGGKGGAHWHTHDTHTHTHTSTHKKTTHTPTTTHSHTHPLTLILTNTHTHTHTQRHLYTLTHTVDMLAVSQLICPPAFRDVTIRNRAGSQLTH